MKQIFADNLKSLRQSKGLTQTQLAKRLGINKSIISAYENQLRFPSVDVLVKLSLEFNISIDYLLGMPKDNTIDVSGLTEEQVIAIINLLKAFR